MPTTTTTTTINTFSSCETPEAKKQFIQDLIEVRGYTSLLGAFYLQGIYFKESWRNLPLEEKIMVIDFVYNNKTFDLSLGAIILEDSTQKILNCFSHKRFKDEIQNIITEIYQSGNPENITNFWYLAASNIDFANVIPSEDELIEHNTEILPKMLNDSALSVCNDETLINTAAKALNVAYIGILLELTKKLQLTEVYASYIQSAYEIISNDKSSEAEAALMKLVDILKHHNMEDIIQPLPEHLVPDNPSKKKLRCMNAS